MDKLQAIWERVGGLFMPSPEAALRMRPSLPIDRDNFTVQVPADRDWACWHSRSLDTKGYTCQNAFMGLEILADAAPQEALVLYFTLEGSFNSPWCELARSVLAYRGVGVYEVPLMANPDSNSTQVRVRLWAQSEETARNMEFAVFGMLSAGYRF